MVMSMGRLIHPGVKEADGAEVVAEVVGVAADVEGEEEEEVIEEGEWVEEVEDFVEVAGAIFVAEGNRKTYELPHLTF